MEFQLNSTLQQDTFLIMDLKLSQLLLMNDQRFPWLILVPRRMGIKELYELDLADQQILVSEITKISELLKMKFDADKINVATLGNIVPQLHIHLIVRSMNDEAWPSPVWGFGNKVPYSPLGVKEAVESLTSTISTLKEIL